jgi:MFS transporter, CP family, cyanate transporter
LPKVESGPAGVVRTEAPRGDRLLLVALVLAALALRPQLVGIGPLLSSIRQGLGVSHSVAGLLSTLVVLCMGLLAPPAYWIARRAGLRVTIAGALTMIAAFGVGRALVPPAGAVIGLTIPVGIGIAVAQSIMPLAVRESWPVRPVLATGVYTAGINGGGAVAAALALPLAHTFGGWRGALTAFSVATGGLMLGWLVLTRHREPHVRPTGELPRLPWRNGNGWLLVLIFSVVSIMYYGLNAWLPSSLVEHGWTHGAAANVLTLMNAVTVPFTIGLAWRGDRSGSRRFWLSLGASCALVALLGVVLVPAAGWVWAALLGAAIGLMFPSMLTLPLDAADQPAEVGAMAAMMLLGGYTVAALAPFLLGALRDAAGSFTIALWLIVADCVVMLGVALSLTPARLARRLHGDAAAAVAR